MFFQFFKCHAIWFDLGFNNELFRFGRRYAFFDRTRLLNCSFLTSTACATIFSRTARSSRSGVSSRSPPWQPMSRRKEMKNRMIFNQIALPGYSYRLLARFCNFRRASVVALLCFASMEEADWLRI